MAKKILLGLTTITPREWRNKVKEIDELGVKEIALFPTCLNISERKELYQQLEKTKLEKIPHVHLKGGMEIFELDYLVARFKTEVFNVHSDKAPHPPLVGCEKYFNHIYVENTPDNLPTKHDLNKYAGVCLDLSHWEAVIMENKDGGKESAEIEKMASQYKIGCNHISAIKREKHFYHSRFLNEDIYCYDSHWLDDLSELDYVKKYRNYLADIISIELENPLKRQMEVKKYLEEVLDL